MGRFLPQASMIGQAVTAPKNAAPVNAEVRLEEFAVCCALDSLSIPMAFLNEALAIVVPICEVRFRTHGDFHGGLRKHRHIRMSRRRHLYVNDGEKTAQFDSPQIAASRYIRRLYTSLGVGRSSIILKPVMIVSVDEAALGEDNPTASRELLRLLMAGGSVAQHLPSQAMISHMPLSSQEYSRASVVPLRVGKEM